MAAEAVDWGPALAVLAVGIVLGLIVAARVRRAPSRPAGDDPAGRRDLEGRRDSLIAQLRELELTASGKDPVRVAEQRRALELQAADVWRRLDALPAPPPAPQAAAEKPAAAAVATPAATTAGSSFRGFAWGVGSAAAIGLLLFAVSRDAGERPAGGSVTGEPGTTAGAPADPAVEALREALARDPEDLQARIALARQHLMRQDLMAVFEETQFVLDRQPANPQALAYQSLVRLAMGQGEMAVGMLRQALAADPDYLEAYVHLALVHTRLGNAAAAAAAIAEAGRRHPDQRAMLERLQTELRAAGAEPGESLPANHPELASPGSAGSEPGPVSASDGATQPRPGEPGYGGRIRLDPDWRGTLRPGSVIYVTVREAGYTSGAPNAVRRIVPGSFPLSFRVGPGDSMMGGELPESARIEARVDSDGDVMTRDPADPVASIDGVPLGSGDIELVLSAPR